MRAILLVWYVYLAVLAGLTMLSAGRRTAVGVACGVASLVAMVLLAALMWGPFGAESWLLPAKAYIALAAAFALARGPRSDTRYVALLLLASAALPLFLHFYQPPA